MVGAGVQLLSGAALGVHLAVHLLATSLLGVSVAVPAVSQHGVDVADRHREAGNEYDHDDHNQSPAGVLKRHLRGLKKKREHVFSHQHPVGGVNTQKGTMVYLYHKLYMIK